MRYRVSPPDVLGRPDIVFLARRIAVFVDGGFWHGRKLAPPRLAEMSAYWQEKIARNSARDTRVNDELANQGWTVLRVDAAVAERRPHEVARLIQRVVRAQSSATVPAGMTLIKPRSSR